MPASKGSRPSLKETLRARAIRPVPPPVLYTPDCIPRVKRLFMSGLTDYEVARALGISATTFLKWKIAYDDLFEACVEGRDARDKRVEDSLYEKAVGYKWTEKQRVTVVDPETGKEEMREVDAEKLMPPDNGAIIFWLKNRRPDQWRDRIDHDVSGKLSISHEQALKDLSG